CAKDDGYYGFAYW
nr:immunoglobulin heavy chain junction region [Mus musculus]